MFATRPGPVGENDTLNVLRVHPSDDAEPRTEITVTFDRRSRAGSKAMFDPAKVFRIDPAVPGKLDWRDPVTLRFVPRDLLMPGAQYRITIANNVASMDGARLDG